jgi:hypothetical protein
MALSDKYRNLSKEEVESLKKNGCSSSDWNRIMVKNGFDTSKCINCIFSGDIYLGVFSTSYTDESGVTIPGGLMNARLHNCSVGSDVSISNTGDYINYKLKIMLL